MSFGGVFWVYDGGAPAGNEGKHSWGSLATGLQYPFIVVVATEFEDGLKATGAKTIVLVDQKARFGIEGNAIDNLTAQK